MIKIVPGEIWKQLRFTGSNTMRNKYAVSSAGRIASYKDDLFHSGKLLNGSLTTGYRTLNLHRPGNRSTLYLHREIAKLFLQRPSPKHKFVIHRNHDKLNNAVKNLKWATLQDMIRHQQKSPAKIAYKEKQANRKVGLKLTATNVRRIKRLLDSKERKVTIKQLSEKYSVSEMTIYRIKSGENWGRIK